MKPSEYLPAITLTAFMATGLCATQFVPFGNADLLVRLPKEQPATAFAAAAAANASLVGIPAPGFAVLHGDAQEIRAALGFAVTWRGKTSCAPLP